MRLLSTSKEEEVRRGLRHHHAVTLAAWKSSSNKQKALGREESLAKITVDNEYPQKENIPCQSPKSAKSQTASK